MQQPVRGNHTGVRSLFANLRNHMLQSHESDGLGHDCLKHIATMQVKGLALVKEYALGISLHVLHYDVCCPGRIRLLYAKLD
jgi:hypothetical protein